MVLVDRPLLLRKLAELEEYLGQMREFSSLTTEAYAGNWKTQRIVERTLQMMIELCSDISGHIIADQQLRVPVTYADAFRSLSEAGLLTPELCVLMEKMARFRNIIVHDYARINAAIVVTILRENLDDFLLYRDAILKIIHDKSPPPHAPPPAHAKRAKTLKIKT